MGSPQNIATEMKSEPPSASERAVISSRLLPEKLAAVRRKHVGVAVGTGGGMALGLFVILSATTMLLDWWLDFSFWARVVMLAWGVGATFVVVWRFVVTPLRRQPDDDTLALKNTETAP